MGHLHNLLHFYTTFSLRIKGNHEAKCRKISRVKEQRKLSDTMSPYTHEHTEAMTALEDSCKVNQSTFHRVQGRGL